MQVLRWGSCTLLLTWPNYFELNAFPPLSLYSTLTLYIPSKGQWCSGISPKTYKPSKLRT
jgi:hypothetical protein